MIVRPADRSDLLGIGRVAEIAHWTSYEGLLRPDTIGRVVSRDFSPSALGRGLLRGGMVVATHEDTIVGFGDATESVDRVQVDALATDPEWRRHGVASAVLAALREGTANLPVAADVLLGHLEAEQFFEANGFIPGEVRQSDLFGATIVERRWWNDAVARPSAASLG